MEPPSNPGRVGALPVAAVALAAAIGLALMADSALRSSATYDEATYLRIACHWWRTGEVERIARMGSPLTFWKLQQAPVLWAIDRAGFASLLDDPDRHQAALLPLVRIGALWIWLVALLVTADWSRRVWGPWGMAFSAWLFALSPNLLAHGALVTMEMPLVVCTVGIFALFDTFLRTGSRLGFWTSAALCGLAFSCKFTAILFPPILGLCWSLSVLQSGDARRLISRVLPGMVGFLVIMALADLAVTGFALLSPSERIGHAHPSIDRLPSPLGGWARRAIESPLPQDWVGFLNQMRHQKSGGPSYLLGERRMRGWRHYYLVALAVKVPLSFWMLVVARLVLPRFGKSDRTLLVSIVAFLAITSLGSSRNYGVRYLLPVAPLAIVWTSGLVKGGRWSRAVALLGLVGQGIAVASIHPHEITYFNAAAGGPSGGRFLLSDSNLDWGQGLKSLARLQADRPEFRRLTLYYFGEARPDAYGVVGVSHVIDAGEVHPGLPPTLVARTPYLAVSASLLWGPWGPPDYFHALRGAKPVAWTDDRTIAIFRTEQALSPGEIPSGSARGPARPDSLEP